MKLVNFESGFRSGKRIFIGRHGIEGGALVSREENLSALDVQGAAVVVDGAAVVNLGRRRNVKFSEVGDVEGRLRSGHVDGGLIFARNVDDTRRLIGCNLHLRSAFKPEAVILGARKRHIISLQRRRASGKDHVVAAMLQREITLALHRNVLKRGLVIRSCGSVVGIDCQVVAVEVDVCHFDNDGFRAVDSVVTAKLVLAVEERLGALTLKNRDVRVCSASGAHGECRGKGDGEDCLLHKASK